LNILIFNCGSSSLNYKVFSAQLPATLEIVCSGKAHRVGVQGSQPSFIQHDRGGETYKQVLPIQNHRQAAVLGLQQLKSEGIGIDAVGHRFVHGGSYFQKSTFLTEENLPQLEACSALAPIHNPNSMSVIDECLRMLPGLPQYLTFDTAFHANLPPAAYNYALPADLVKKYSLRRYGFHGLSYQFVTQAAARYLNTPLQSMRMVICHLGTGGSSIAAIEAGVSVDTSMGYSPLSGLVMSTRTGDLDPFLPVYMLRELQETPTSLTALFNKKSGLLAFEMYAYHIRKTIGAYAALLGGMDVLVFTDDIGAQDWRVRQAVCQGLDWCGILLDEQANRQALQGNVNQVSCSTSPVRVLAMPTDEELVIGLEGFRLLKDAGYVNS